MRDMTRHIVGREPAGRRPIICANCNSRAAEYTDDIKLDPLCAGCYENAPGVIGLYGRRLARALGHSIVDGIKGTHWDDAA